MALPQDGQDANGLTKVTQIPAGKELMFIDPTTNEGGIITLEDLTKQILNGLASQAFALDAGQMTLPAALNYLYGKKESNSENIDSASDLAEDVLEKCHNGEIRLFTIQSTVSIEKGSPDGQGGFLLAYQSKAGSAYGIVVLFSYSEKIWMKVKDITWNNWKKIQLS